MAHLDFGRPGNYYARQIARWSQQYLASETEKIPAMQALMEWLPAHVPESDETRIVHGDYRIGNCIVHPREPRIVAVLDWELSTLGHPLADLAYFCMCLRLPRDRRIKGLSGLPLAEIGIQEERELSPPTVRAEHCPASKAGISISPSASSAWGRSARAC